MSSAGFASGGRARSKSALSTVTSKAETPTAASAAPAARGVSRRREQSPAQPMAAINGHFTHQADASRSTNVSGWKRMLSPNEDTAPSHA